MCVKSLLSGSSIVLDLRWRRGLTKFVQNLLFFIFIFFLDGVIQDVSFSQSAFDYKMNHRIHI